MLDRCATGLRLRPHERIARIHDDFVKDLVETRIEGDRAIHHFRRSGVPDPSRLGVRLRAADIGIGQLQNVLAVRVLLVGCCVHLFSG